MPHLFIIVNDDWFFLSHRKDIALAALYAGYEVTIVAHDSGCGSEIEALGLHFRNLPYAKSIQNPLKEFGIFLFLYSLYRKQKPDIVHHVGLKLIFYGTMAAGLSKVKNIVNAVSGLGILFSE
jgi:hypothetical protein